MKTMSESQSASGIVDAETSRTALFVGQGKPRASVLFLQATPSRRRPNDTHADNHAAYPTTFAE
jgi:hypothetical protein